ncbi:superoxide dismutase family protein [Streptomyces pratensis]|uniref:superoxide dismutase family protein n=1 Tax=Streptomyces pratensis TaxID=1169025 RepID=UPI003015CF41
MTAGMVRTGCGPSHQKEKRGAAVCGRGGVLPGVPGAVAGAVVLLMLAGGVGVAHGPHDQAHDVHTTALPADGVHGEEGPGLPGEGGGTARASRFEDGVVGPVGGVWTRAAGVFSPPGAFLPSKALTYDTGLVPAGARIEVTQYADGTRSRIAARLRGLPPDRAYGMHVHTRPCGADPAAAGPHYQHRASATADPVNEVWLDFRTDADGDGRAEARHGWNFRKGGARSVVIHDRQGGAGERAACFTVPFGPTDDASGGGADGVAR